MLGTRSALYHHGLFHLPSVLSPQLKAVKGAGRELARRLRQEPATVAAGGLAAVRFLGEAMGLHLETGEDRLCWLSKVNDPSPILIYLRPPGAPLSSVERDEWMRGGLLSPPVNLWRQLRRSGIPWGVITDGRRLRLQHRDALPDHHLSVELSPDVGSEEITTIDLLVGLLGEQGGGLRDRWWEDARRREAKVIRLLGRELARRRDDAGRVGPLDRWCFLVWLAEGLGSGAAVEAWKGEGGRDVLVSLLRGNGWTAEGAEEFLHPLEGWRTGGGVGELAALHERLGEDLGTALQGLDGLAFSRLWEGPQTARMVAQDGVFWREAFNESESFDKNFQSIRRDVLAHLGEVQRQVEHGPVAAGVWEHLWRALSRQRQLLRDHTVLDLAPRRGFRLVAWIEQRSERLLLDPGYVSPWSEAEVEGEIDRLRATLRDSLFAVLPSGSDPLAVICPLASVAPTVPWPGMEKRVVCGDWQSAAALTDLALPLASRRAKAGQADLFEHAFREHLRMLRADFHLLCQRGELATLPPALAHNEERVRIGADVVNAWLAGEEVPWAGVEQVVAQIRGDGSDPELEQSPWCRRARRWVAERGLLYLELAFPEQLLEEGRLGFQLVVGGHPCGKRTGSLLRRRVHAMLAPGGVACWLAERDSAGNLGELAGAEVHPIAVDESGRLACWHRLPDEA